MLQSTLDALALNPLYANGYSLLNRICAVSPIRTYIDAGANDGGMIGFALDDMEVHAFEPVPDMFAALAYRFRNRPRTHFNQIALSNAPVPPAPTSIVNVWTLGLPGQYPHMDAASAYAGKTFDVAFTTLDDYCASHDLRVGVAKIDVDGYEFRLLRGASKVIARDRPALYFELSYLLSRMGEKIDDLLHYILDEMGYTFANVAGTFHTDDFSTIQRNFPYDTSFDVVLLPKERLSLWLP